MFANIVLSSNETNHKIVFVASATWHPIHIFRWKLTCYIISATLCIPQFYQEMATIYAANFRLKYFSFPFTCTLTLFTNKTMKLKLQWGEMKLVMNILGSIKAFPLFHCVVRFDVKASKVTQVSSEFFFPPISGYLIRFHIWHYFTFRRITAWCK